MTLEMLKVPYEVKETSPIKSETRTPEFLKMNPMHNIPTFKQGDFVLNESRAIMTYLATIHKDEKLYPTDPKTRAIVDQRLYFDIGSFNNRFINIIVSSLNRHFPNV